MTRIAVGIEYDGTAYVGWQSQQSGAAIQNLAQAALASVADEPVSLICAGRTDAGVHARGQVAHFDTQAERSSRSWVLGANTSLPRDINLAWATPVPRHFHARYSVEARTYRYYIFNRPVRSGLTARTCAWVRRPLDHERMSAAAAALLGKHDFSAFRSSVCQARSPVRVLESLTVERYDEFLVIEATANAFLHHMMRNIAGLLLTIGAGEEEPGWARDVLASQDRTRGGPTAPPEGLYLWCVRYPQAFGLPVRRSAMIPSLIDSGV